MEKDTVADNYKENRDHNSKENIENFRQCLNCNWQNPSTSNYCQHCGYALKTNIKCLYFFK